MDFSVSDKMKTITSMIDEFVDKELIPMEPVLLTRSFKRRTTPRNTAVWGLT